MNQKDFFNSMAEKWDSMCHHDLNKINEILDLADIRQGDTILDVGTGTGIMIPCLISRIGNTGEVTAIDVADKMIEAAKNKYSYSNVNYIVGDVFNSDLPVEYFDVIMCYSVFPHFEYKLTAIEKLGKFLKSGGKIVICHSQSRNEINHMHKNSSPVISRDYLPDADTIKGYFSRYNFDTVADIDTQRMFVVIGQKTLLLKSC